jgi:hypothetical protein
MALDLNDPEVKSALDAAAKQLAAELVAGETAGLKKSQQELLKEKKALEARIAGLPQDFDPEEYTRLREEADKQREEREKAAGNWEKLKLELIQKHDAAMKKAAAEREALEAERQAAIKRYQAYFVESAVTSAIAKSDGLPQILMPHVLSNVKFVPGENGAADGVLVVGKDGSPRLKDGKGAVMGLDDLLAEMKADDIFGRGFKASGASGGGAGGSGGANGGAGGKTMKRAAFDALGPAERSAFMRGGGSLVD